MKRWYLRTKIHDVTFQKPAGSWSPTWEAQILTYCQIARLWA